MKAIEVIQILESTAASRGSVFGEQDSSAILARDMAATVREMWELLHAAKGIADRQGVGTAWGRFSASVEKLGINGMTARTYRVLPDEESNTE